MQFLLGGLGSQCHAKRAFDGAIVVQVVYHHFAIAGDFYLFVFHFISGFTGDAHGRHIHGAVALKLIFLKAQVVFVNTIDLLAAGSHNNSQAQNSHQVLVLRAQ